MWERISLLGITDEMDDELAERVGLVNRVAVVAAVLCVLVACWLQYMGWGYQSCAFVLVGLLTLCTLLLNKNKQHQSAAMLLLTLLNASVLCLTWLLDIKSGAHLLFLYVGILPWLTLSLKERTYAISYSVLSAGCFIVPIFVNHDNTISLDPVANAVIYIVSFFFVAAIVIATVTKLLNRESAASNAAATSNKALKDAEKKLKDTLTENHAVISFAQTMYSNANSLDELCNAGLFKLKEIMGFTYAAILVYDKDTDMLNVQAEMGFDSSERRAASFRNGETMTGKAFQQQQTIRVNDTPQNYWYASSGLGAMQPAELIIVPMTFKSQAGVLELAFINPLNDAAMAMLQRISVALAANILPLLSKEENKQLVAELQRQKDEIAHSYAELEQLKETASDRMKEQYEAQQTLIKQIIDKSKQREQELLTQIAELKQS